MDDVGLSEFMIKATQIGRALEHDKDEQIKAAITEFIGNDKWQAADIINRCRIDIRGRYEIFSLDGAPLLRFHALKSEQNGYVLTCSRKIERLF